MKIYMVSLFHRATIKNVADLRHVAVTLKASYKPCTYSLDAIVLQKKRDISLGTIKGSGVSEMHGW